MSLSVAVGLVLLVCAGICHAQTFNCRVYMPDFLTQTSFSGSAIATTINSLATQPFVLAQNDPQSKCTMGDQDSAVLAEMVIFDPTPPTGYSSNFYVYHPLIVNQLGSSMGVPSAPLIDPTKVETGMFSANAVSAVFFSTFNGPFTFFDNSTTPSPTLPVASRLCYSGPAGSLNSFVLFGACNTDLFWSAVNTALAKANGKDLNPPVPDLGIDPVTGLPCPTVRDFAFTDSTPSDGVVTSYIVNVDTGAVAQNTQDNERIVDPMNINSILIFDRSNQRLIAVAISNLFQAVPRVNETLVCQAYRAPNLSDNRQSMIGAMALNEIHAAMTAPKPWALSPRGDPMTRRPLTAQQQDSALPGSGSSASNLLGNVAPYGVPDLARLNLLRQARFQPMVTNLTEASTKFFCAHFVTAAAARLSNADFQNLLENAVGEYAGQNLFTDLAARLMISFDMLGCGTLLDIPNPVTLLPLGSTPVTAADAVIQIDPQVVWSRVQSKDPYAVKL